MKLSVSEWLLHPKPEPDVQNSPSWSVFTGIDREVKLLSDEGKLLLLTQLYLELTLSLEHAQCAARADILAANASNGKVISNQ